MSNLVAFKSVVRRAQTKADNQICLIENMPITTNVGIILFANQHINKLEEQLVGAYAKIAKMNEIANKCGLIFDMDVIEATINGHTPTVYEYVH